MVKFNSETFTSPAGSTFDIRHLSEDDAEQFIQLRLQAARDSTNTNQHEGMTLPDVNELCLRLAIEEDSPTHLNLGAFDAGRLIGLIGIRKPKEDHPWLGHLGYFGMMINKPYWGQGLGRCLLKHGLEFCRQSGISKLEGHVRASNYRAQYLYLSMGLAFEGRRKHAAHIHGAMNDEYFLGWSQHDPLPSIDFALRSELITVQPLWAVKPRAMAAYVAAHRGNSRALGLMPETTAIMEDYWWQRRVQALDDFYSDRALEWVVTTVNDPSSVIGMIGFSRHSCDDTGTCVLSFCIGKKVQDKNMADALSLSIKFIRTRMNVQRILVSPSQSPEGLPTVLKEAGFMENIGRTWVSEV